MNKRVDTLVGEVALLAPEQRLAIVDRILATVHPTHPDVDEAWIAEAEERMAAYDRGEVETFDADEVLAELRGTCKYK